MVTKILVKGIVQGVGFRPFVYRIATEMGYSGFVKNTPNGVEIVLNTTNSQDFIATLYAQLPRLAKIEDLTVSAFEGQCSDGFVILETQQGQSATKISADFAMCEDCLVELFDPNSRYYLYPFINCTNCGPRYSVVKGLPYDRPQTTLANFPLCPQCLSAYTDPLDRRYHAQATVCERCGPRLSHGLPEIITAIQAGKIIALKGSGGFHLICDANNAEAVQRLRARKRRPTKPFALMACNIASLTHFVEMTEQEKVLLTERQAPIVLMQRKADAPIANEIAPHLDQLGFMLPAIPLHFLLFYYYLGQPSGTAWMNEPHPIALVMTSANFSGGTIIADNAQAHQVLGEIADMIVDYNREIAIKADDSVVSVDMMVRRSRGYAPEVIELPEALPSVLGLGTLLKNTFCFIDGKQAIPSQYLGDMDSQYTIDYFDQVLAHYQKAFGLKAEVIATDLHPDFYPSQYAEKLGLPIYSIQHHEAHLGAVIAEHGLQGQVFGVILDGYGYGHDGGAWGGELILANADQAEFTHLGHLEPMAYVSGDKVQRESWRMALSLAHQFALEVPPHIAQKPLSPAFLSLLSQSQVATTTSCGRLFDGMASLLGIADINHFEAEVAMRFEALASPTALIYDDYDAQSPVSLKLSQLLRHTLQQPSLKAQASYFHASLAGMIVTWVDHHAQALSIRQIALNGGCFQNRWLRRLASQELIKKGYAVYMPQKMPFNDGGVSLGQAWIGAKKHQLQGN